MEYRKRIFEIIHEIVFHGNGGYDWDTVYNMPIWLRNFTFHKIKEFYEAKKETVDGGGTITAGTSKEKLDKLRIKSDATYTSKAPIKK